MQSMCFVLRANIYPHEEMKIKTKSLRPICPLGVWKVNLSAYLMNKKLLFLVLLYPCKTNDRTELQKRWSRLPTSSSPSLPQALRTPTAELEISQRIKPAPAFVYDGTQVPEHNPIPARLHNCNTETIDDCRQWNSRILFVLVASHLSCWGWLGNSLFSFVTFGPWSACQGWLAQHQSMRARSPSGSDWLAFEWWYAYYYHDYYFALRLCLLLKTALNLLLIRNLKHALTFTSERNNFWKIADL